MSAAAPEAPGSALDQRRLFDEAPMSGAQITKLKLVKRQMYGRGKLDLLQARVIASGA